MSYFKVLGLIVGFAAMLKLTYALFWPQNMNAFVLNTYGKKKPAWIIPATIATMGLVGLTWYMHFTTEVPYSIIVTIFVSLALLKMVVLLFNYQSLQKKMIETVVNDKGRDIAKQNIVGGIVGLVVFLLALFVY